jgi:hypothetical protein
MPTNDPWVHRSAGMKCSTCMYFVPKRAPDTCVLPIGRCRRNAPTMKGYPVVLTSDWCGEHKLDEAVFFPKPQETQMREPGTNPTKTE